jgi:hypothetical protein
VIKGKGEHAEGAPDPIVRRRSSCAATTTPATARGSATCRLRCSSSYLRITLIVGTPRRLVDKRTSRRRDGGGPPRSWPSGCCCSASCSPRVPGDAAAGAGLRAGPAGARARTSRTGRRCPTRCSGGPSSCPAAVPAAGRALTASRAGDRAAAEVRPAGGGAAQRAVHGPGSRSSSATRPRPSRSTRPPASGCRCRRRQRPDPGPGPAEPGERALGGRRGGGVGRRQRLAPTTTIRAAGEAILVDLRPVQSPYTLAAVGTRPRCCRGSPTARRRGGSSRTPGCTGSSSPCGRRRTAGCRRRPTRTCGTPRRFAADYCVGFDAGFRSGAATSGGGR